MSTGNACFTDPPSFSPKNYPGLIAWYDSVNSPIFDIDLYIIGLRDLSRNANNLVASNQSSILTFNSIYNDTYNGINFTAGANTFVNTTPIEFQNILSGLTIFIVATTPSNIQPFNYISIFNDTFSMRSIQVLITSFYSIDATQSNQIAINPQNNNYGTFISGSNFDNLNLITAISFNSNYNDNYSASTYQNGTLASVYNTSPNININNRDINTFNITIGEDGTYKNGEFHATGGISIILYEMIIYNKVLSESNISDINNYLQNKYQTPVLYNGGSFIY